VLEKILDYLDDKSLCMLHQVCSYWNEAINRSLAWNRKLQYKVSLFCLPFHKILYNSQFLFNLEQINDCMESNI
jgi:hypothetical protein